MRFTLACVAFLVVGCSSGSGGGGGGYQCDVDCGSFCCPAGQSCGVNGCVDGCAVPCGNACCAAGQSCTNGVCSSGSRCQQGTPCGNVCCTGQQQCINSQCCIPCGGACCSNGDVCLNAQCCAANKVCGATCCNDNADCITDGAGNKFCATKCSVSKDCPANAPCCGVIKGATVCLPNPTMQNSYSCTCTIGSDCSSGACAPLTNGNDIVIGPYVCKPNNGQAWQGCEPGSGPCVGGYDCWKDGNGNQFCTRSCNNDATCGNPGVACCNTQATCHNDVLSCSGSGGCMLCQ